MLLNKESYFIKESININSKTKKNLAIFFSDMVNSSKLWLKNPERMLKVVEEHSIVLDKWIKKHKGFVIKTIGDAYMASFDSIDAAIKCAIDIQDDLKNNPIKIDNKELQLRIGITYGPVYTSTVTFQDNIKIIDYFGNTVNSAARIESEVSDPGSFAFALLNEDLEDINLDDLLKDYKVDLISFKNKNDEVNRSKRLLTDIHRHFNKSIKNLKGIEKIDVYKVHFK